MRIMKNSGVKISSAFKGGDKVEPLSDSEYATLEKMVKKVKDFTKNIKFDEKSDIIFAKIPDNYPPQERVNAQGKSFWSISLKGDDDKWMSMITNDQNEANIVEGHQGAGIAIVGKIKEEIRETKTFLNIKGYRGSIIVDEGDLNDDATHEDPNL